MFIEYVKMLHPRRLVDKITGWIQEKFHSVEYYIKHVYNIEIDKSGKDVCRACFICHDPEAKINIEQHFDTSNSDEDRK